MNAPKRAVILVPDCSGGIDRLFERLPGIWRARESLISISLFKTHGRSLYGISVLPFKLVYYSSAIIYMTLFFPVRVLKFLGLCILRRIDLCHINLSTGASTFRKMTFAGICRLFGVKYVIHLHGGKYREFFANVRPFYRRWIQTFFQRADRVIVLGELWRKFVIAEIGVSSDMATILPNAVSGPADFESVQKSDPKQILFLGRLFEPKGINELMTALSDDRMTALPWTAVLAGDGEVASVRRNIAAMGLSHRIQVTGWVDSATVADLLSQSTIFVLPSYTENLPLSMLEAMAYGLCPVVTPVGSIEDVIEDRRNGLVVPVRDSAALIDALVQLLQDKTMCTNIAAAARADFLRFYDIEKYQDNLEVIYGNVLHATR